MIGMASVRQWKYKRSKEEVRVVERTVASHEAPFRNALSVEHVPAVRFVNIGFVMAGKRVDPLVEMREVVHTL